MIAAVSCLAAVALAAVCLWWSSRRLESARRTLGRPVAGLHDDLAARTELVAAEVDRRIRR